MTQHVTHICSNCGWRIRCDRSTPTRTFETVESSPSLTSSSPWPNIQYEVYWGISKITDGITKALAVWIPANAIMLGVSMRYDWTPVIPQIFSVASLAGLIRIFGKVPSWHNAIETEPPALEPQAEPEPEDTRKFIGWETETHTKSTQRLEWYTSPVPIPQARSYALALVNNGFQWIGERDLANFKANISGPNYRKLRRDWLDREWCTETGDKRTVIVNKTLIRRIAFEPPK